MLINDKYYPISLLSYPRSGSNWLCYCIEQLSGILTIGNCMDTKEKLDSEKCLIAKTHGHGNIDCNGTIYPFPIMKQFDKEKDGLILLIRNYKECIPRHLEIGNSNRLDYLDFKIYKKELYNTFAEDEKQHPTYINNIMLYEECKNKIMIYYEDLIQNFEYEINRILVFLHKYGENKDAADLDVFMSKFKYHVDKSLSFYAPISATKGDKRKIIYHSNKLTTKIKLQIDDYLEENFTWIFNNYLIRYKE